MIDLDTRDRIMAAPEALLAAAGVMNALIGAGGRWARTSSICAGWRWSGRSAAAIRTANHITQCAGRHRWGGSTASADQGDGVASADRQAPRTVHQGLGEDGAEDFVKGLL